MPRNDRCLHLDHRRRSRSPPERNRRRESSSCYNSRSESLKRGNERRKGTRDYVRHKGDDIDGSRGRQERRSRSRSWDGGQRVRDLRRRSREWRGESSGREKSRKKEEKKEIKKEEIENEDFKLNDIEKKENQIRIRSSSYLSDDRNLDHQRGEPPLSKPEEPNFEPSGLLTQETNTKNGVVLKYNEPPDARHPNERWRLYVFKSGDETETKILHLHRTSCFLVGKDPRICEVCLVHPSISKQHAAIQFRHRFGRIQPYLIDLDSTNGTFLNGKKIEASRYYELRSSDSLKFGSSSRDLVILNESATKFKEFSYSEFADADVSRKRQDLRINDHSE